MNPAVRKAYATFDVETSRLLLKVRGAGKPVPCGPRCDSCCYDIAWVVAEEVDELVERVRSMPTAKRAQVLHACQEWLDGMRAAGLDPDNTRPDLRTYHRAHLACPLLDTEEHACRVYDLRPLSCRGHYVVAETSAPCANRMNEPVIETVEFPESLTSAMMTMFESSMERARLATDELLPRALGRRLGIR
jgi:Fe-S-cluster containining protein